MKTKPKKQESTAELAKLFLKLGFIAFGGPAAHIAMMQREVVEKRKWITKEHFLDLVGATNLIPGPNSTEMTMHIGHERAGWKGLMVAGTCFIVPAVLITAILAWFYQQYGRLPQVQPFIYGIKPAIIAVIVSLMITLGKSAVKNPTLAAFGILAALAAFSGINEIIVLFATGAAGTLFHVLGTGAKPIASVFPILLQVNAPNFTPDKWSIFWIFLKVGVILYGSGYVLFAFLDAELVSKGLLPREILIDAIAAGQVTPGPVFSSATFIGWQMGGASGAVAATVGIFLPSFLFVALLNPLIPKLRKSALMSVFLDTVNVASVALILVVCVEMGKDTITDWRTVCITLAGFFVGFKFPQVNSALIILGGAVSGWLLLFL